jgi:hypothetical protein
MTNKEKEVYLILHGWQVRYLPDFKRDKFGTIIKMKEKILKKYYFGPDNKGAHRNVEVAYNIETFGISNV